MRMHDRANTLLGAIAGVAATIALFTKHTLLPLSTLVPKHTRTPCACPLTVNWVRRQARATRQQPSHPGAAHATARPLTSAVADNPAVS